MDKRLLTIMATVKIFGSQPGTVNLVDLTRDLLRNSEDDLSNRDSADSIFDKCLQNFLEMDPKGRSVCMAHLCIYEYQKKYCKAIVDRLIDDFFVLRLDFDMPLLYKKLSERRARAPRRQSEARAEYFAQFAALDRFIAKKNLINTAPALPENTDLE